MLSKCLKLVIMGLPGSGKGTIANRISNEFKLNLFSSGDLLRHEIFVKSEIGMECEPYIRKGQLVPEELFEDILLENLTYAGKGKGWLLDGYPRSIKQATALYNEPFIPDMVIDLQVPREEIIARVKDRWIHPASGRVYNLRYEMPKVEGKDDKTGEPLVQRPDDHPETVSQRLDIYEEKTMPVYEFFRSRGKLEVFHGTKSDVIWPEVKEYLVQFVAKRNIEHNFQ